MRLCHAVEVWRAGCLGPSGGLRTERVCDRLILYERLYVLLMVASERAVVQMFGGWREQARRRKQARDCLLDEETTSSHAMKHSMQEHYRAWQRSVLLAHRHREVLLFRV
jgi:hypothetical protein